MAKKNGEKEITVPECANIGRIVHFVHDSGAVAPAMILHLDEEKVANLIVFINGIPRFTSMIARAAFDEKEERKQGTWHWPEKV